MLLPRVIANQSMFGQEACICTPFLKGGRCGNTIQKGSICLYAEYRGLLYCSLSAFNGCSAVFSMHNHFSDHRVIKLRDFITTFNTTVDADTWSFWFNKACYQTCRGQEVFLGIFCIETHLDGVSTRAYLVLGQLEWLAGCDKQLVADQIYARHKLGDRVLYLQACVHLKKIEVSIGVKYKFYRTSIDVSGCPGNTHSGRSHPGT